MFDQLRYSSTPLKKKKKKASSLKFFANKKEDPAPLWPPWKEAAHGASAAAETLHSGFGPGTPGSMQIPAAEQLPALGNI